MDIYFYKIWKMFSFFKLFVSCILPIFLSYYFLSMTLPLLHGKIGKTCPWCKWKTFKHIWKSARSPRFFFLSEHFSPPHSLVVADVINNTYIILYYLVLNKSVLVVLINHQHFKIRWGNLDFLSLARLCNRGLQTHRC